MVSCNSFHFQSVIPIKSTTGRMFQTFSELCCVKYRYFTEFPGVEILRKGRVSAEFRANRPELCGNCAFPQNFHTKKLGQISIFYAVIGFKRSQVLLNFED